MIPPLTVAFMIFDMLFGVFIPVFLAIYFRKKYGCRMLPFWIGCIVMLVFAFVLERLAHSFILESAFRDVLESSIWLYALYTGLMAGLFEETGRLIAMKLALKKYRDRPHTALMYGAGHGGFEAFAVLTVTMVSNLSLTILINSGGLETAVGQLSGAAAQQLRSAADTLMYTSPHLFLLGAVERVLAVATHIALSVLVWTAVVKKGRIGYYFLAITFHLLMDGAVVVLQNMYIPVMLTECVLCVLTAIYVITAIAVWKRELINGTICELDSSSGSD